MGSSASQCLRAGAGSVELSTVAEGVGERIDQCQFAVQFGDGDRPVCWLAGVGDHDDRDADGVVVAGCGEQHSQGRPRRKSRPSSGSPQPIVARAPLLPCAVPDPAVGGGEVYFPDGVHDDLVADLLAVHAQQLEQVAHPTQPARRPRATLPTLTTRSDLGTASPRASNVRGQDRLTGASLRPWRRLGVGWPP
jgi:hypothetical protein